MFFFLGGGGGLIIGILRYTIHYIKGALSRYCSTTLKS